VRPTLIEACGRAGLEPPVSHADLVHVLHRLRELGIPHNLLGSPVMRLAEERCHQCKEATLHPWRAEESL
jgi:type II secretory ATPase GspE/PulE/Tfp pilus assembly ATPase PilB-like protein